MAGNYILHVLQNIDHNDIARNYTLPFVHEDKHVI